MCDAGVVNKLGTAETTGEPETEDETTVFGYSPAEMAKKQAEDPEFKLLAEWVAGKQSRQKPRSLGKDQRQSHTG